MARDITVEQILKDMESSLIVRDELLPGDILVGDIVEHFHVSKDTAYVYMEKMAESGKFRKVKIYHAGTTRTALRKVDS